MYMGAKQKAKTALMLVDVTSGFRFSIRKVK
jgi:hypothetical protein